VTARELRVSLTRREKELIRAVLDGCSNRQMAHRFAVSEQTVKNQLSTLYAKLRITSRLELAVTAVRRRLIEEGDP
jgi:DNA-binding NarL/FixJ family response regulator